MLKRAIIGVFLLVGSWLWSGAMATITVTTDSAFQLTGSFSASSSADSETASSAIFGNSVNQLLPGGVSFNFLVLWRSNEETGRILRFQTTVGGTPDNPRFDSTFDDAPRTFVNVSGMYNNNPNSTPVYFLFSSLADSGGAFGSFSGNFAFSTSPLSPIPEPEIYAMMMAGLGLVGFVARKKKPRVSVTEVNSRMKVVV